MAATVGTRELKTRLGRYLRLVRGGATLVVTDRGRPVAELRPLARDEDDEDAVLREAAALGRVTLATRRGPLRGFRPLTIRGRPLSATVREDREARI